MIHTMRQQSKGKRILCNIQMLQEIRLECKFKSISTLEDSSVYLSKHRRVEKQMFVKLKSLEMIQGRLWLFPVQIIMTEISTGNIKYSL